MCVSFLFKAVKKHETARRRQLAAAARFPVGVACGSVGAVAAESAGCSAAAVVQLVCWEAVVAVQLVGL
jgi:hypothetical protein